MTYYGDMTAEEAYERDEAALHACDHDDIPFPVNDDGEIVCRLCWEVIG